MKLLMFQNESGDEPTIWSLSPEMEDMDLDSLEGIAKHQIGDDYENGEIYGSFYLEEISELEIN